MNKKTFYLYLICIFLLIIIFRYPIIDHEKGNDSFGNHLSAQGISDKGFDSKYLSILSVFGLYPFSQNMGGSFLLVSFHLSTGLNLENSIFLIGIILAIIGSLGMFMFSKKITNDNFLSLNSALIFANCRVLMVYTSWNFSYRGPFMFILPFLFYFVLDFLNKSKYRSLILSVIFFIVLFSIHRMSSISLYVVVIVFAMNFLLKSRNNFVRIYFSKIKTPVWYTFFLSVPIILIDYYIDSQTEEWIDIVKPRHEFWYNFIPIIDYYLSIGMEYAFELGILILLVPFGYIYLLRNIQFDNNRFILASILFFFIPFLEDQVYFAMFLTFFLSFYASYGLKYFNEFFLKKSSRYSFFIAFNILFISLCQAVPFFVTINDSEPLLESYPQATVVEEPLFDAAIYLCDKKEGYVMTNYEYLGGHLQVYSNKGYTDLPNIVLEEQFEFVGWINLTTGNYKEIFTRGDVSGLSYTLQYDLFTDNFSVDDRRTKVVLDSLFGYETYYVAVFNEIQGEAYLDYYRKVAPVKFFSTIEDYSYKSFSNELITIYEFKYNKT